MIYDTISQNLQKSNAFQPKHNVDPAAIKAFMARITGQATPLTDSEKTEMQNAINDIAAELKTKLFENQLQVRKQPLVNFNDGMDFFHMNTGVVDFPVKLIQRGKEVTDVDGLQAKLEEHGILMVELHFTDGDVFEFVMRHRKGDEDFYTFAYKV